MSDVLYWDYNDARDLHNTKEQIDISKNDIIKLPMSLSFDY